MDTTTLVIPPQFKLDTSCAVDQMVDRSLLGLGVYELEFEMKATHAFGPNVNDEGLPLVPSSAPDMSTAQQEPPPQPPANPLTRGVSSSSIVTAAESAAALEAPAKRARTVEPERNSLLMEEMDVEEDRPSRCVWAGRVKFQVLKLSMITWSACGGMREGRACLP